MLDMKDLKPPRPKKRKFISDKDIKKITENLIKSDDKRR